ncbi:MAG: hypothetical protein J0H94_17300 [Rhizobiales bacterium]|nr:hypothetical protein [Hyphomicrobiales bacterium]
MNRFLLASAAVAALAFVAVPARADDDADLCKYMQDVAAGANQQQGKMIDQITKGEEATTDCDGKVLSLAWSVTVGTDKLNPGWGESLKGNIEKIACGDAGVKKALDAGWKVKVTWTPASGDPYSGEVSCP